MMTSLVLPGVPFPLEPSGNPPVRSVVAGGVLTLTCGPESDLFIDPSGVGKRLDAGRLTGLPGDWDFTFAARVSVRFGAVFDAGVLLLIDMFGGTPSNLGMTFLEKDRLEVITGVNLPMLLKLASLQTSQDLLAVARAMRDHGRSAIWVASDLLRGEKVNA